MYRKNHFKRLVLEKYSMFPISDIRQFFLSDYCRKKVRSAFSDQKRIQIFVLFFNMYKKVF